MLPFAEWASWLIPIVGSVLVPLFFRAGKRVGEVYSVILGFAAASFSISMIPDVWGGNTIDRSVSWIPLPTGGSVDFGLLLDPLSVMMACIATGIGSLILLYSVGYMAHESGLPRYYFFMTFFIGGMTLLVLSDNLLGLYIGWEIVGVCSYALISFYYNRHEARLAGIKAFITTRIGDVMLLTAILLLYSNFGTLNILGLRSTIEEAAKMCGKVYPVLMLALLLAFGGAMGKSAQFPLHVWLPDAMEGPTPVSALIHAATMVKAGVYLVARFSMTLVPFEHFSPQQLSDWYATVITIGAFTAIFAATMGLVMNDIKRVIAYSTISQLALMFTSLGVGSASGWFGGVFHVLSHSAFKALLFLAAGSVIHVVATNNMDEMGGLRRYMPVTFYTSLIGVLSLSGIPPFSGFFSKDFILSSLLESGNYLALMLISLASVLTVIYSFRWISMVFLGEPKKLEMHGHIHESPLVMTAPLMVLAGLSAVAGLPPVEEALLEFMGIHHVSISPLTYVFSGVILAVGLGVSYLFFIARRIPT
ncbi:MAG: NADH-quinone oxidoreductase subunit L, partial [Nitrososphaerota archaeon]